MKVISTIIIYIYIGSIAAATRNAPCNILDSTIYQNPKHLDNMHQFLGLHIPKSLFLQLSEKDKDLTLRLLIEALETSPSFVDHKWNNMDNQHRGIVTVMPIETVNEQKCRKFNVQFIISDNHYELQGQSCRINNRWDIDTP